MYSFVKTQKGSTAIYFQEHLYRLQKRNKNGTDRWICTNRSCSSSLVIKNGSLKISDSVHNHSNKKPSLNVINVIHKIRDQVRNSDNIPVTQIYNQITADFRQMNGTAESVPVFDVLRSTLYRDKALFSPKNPKTIDDIVIPENMKKNLYQEKMLFCDENIPSRILGFASVSALKELANCTIWNADGTFKTSPKLFTQSYTIHAHNQFSMKPIVFAVLQNKNEETYLRLLQSLVIYATTNNIILAPQSILIDFEVAAYNAFQHVFPNATVLFCHFHFAKNIMKHLKQLRLNDDLKKDLIKREIANILSLPLLPPNKVYAALDDASDTLLSNNRQFETFVNYVKKTYVVDPKFNILNWSHYNTISERPRTNNHRVIAKPTLWRWITQIKIDDEQTIIRSEQENKQNRSTRPRKRKHIEHDICLNELKNLYETKLIDIIHYQKKLRNITYKYIDVLHGNINDTETDI